MTTRLYLFLLLATVLLFCSNPTIAVLVRIGDLTTLEKLEETARKYFTGNKAQLEENSIARSNYQDTLETLISHAGQLTGLTVDTYMRIKKEFITGEITTIKDSLVSLLEERKQFNSTSSQSTSLSEEEALRRSLKLAEFDADIETQTTYLDLLERRFSLLWKDGDLQPLGQNFLLPSGLVAHGYVSLGFRYFIEDPQNLMFLVHPKKFKIAEALYDVFYDALCTLHEVYLKLKLPFPKAKNVFLQSRLDLFNPLNKQTSLDRWGLGFITANLRYFEEKLTPTTSKTLAIQSALAKLTPPVPLALQEPLAVPTIKAHFTPDRLDSSDHKDLRSGTDTAVVDVLGSNALRALVPSVPTEWVFINRSGAASPTLVTLADNSAAQKKSIPTLRPIVQLEDTSLRSAHIPPTESHVKWDDESNQFVWIDSDDDAHSSHPLEQLHVLATDVVQSSIALTIPSLLKAPLSAQGLASGTRLSTDLLNPPADGVDSSSEQDEFMLDNLLKDSELQITHIPPLPGGTEISQTPVIHLPASDTLLNPRLVKESPVGEIHPPTNTLTYPSDDDEYGDIVWDDDLDEPPQSTVNGSMTPPSTVVLTSLLLPNVPLSEHPLASDERRDPKIQRAAVESHSTEIHGHAAEDDDWEDLKWDLEDFFFPRDQLQSPPQEVSNYTLKDDKAKDPTQRQIKEHSDLKAMLALHEAELRKLKVSQSLIERATDLAIKRVQMSEQALSSLRSQPNPLHSVMSNFLSTLRSLEEELRPAEEVETSNPINQDLVVGPDGFVQIDRPDSSLRPATAVDQDLVVDLDGFVQIDRPDSSLRPATAVDQDLVVDLDDFVPVNVSNHSLPATDDELDESDWEDLELALGQPQSLTRETVTPTLARTPVPTQTPVSPTLPRLGSDNSVEDDKDEDMESIQKQMEEHLELKARLATHEAQLQELEKSRALIAKATHLATKRVQVSAQALSSLRLRQNRVHSVMSGFESTLRSLNAEVRSAGNEARSIVHSLVLDTSSETDHIRTEEKVSPSISYSSHQEPMGMSPTITEENMESTSPTSSTLHPTGLKEYFRRSIQDLSLVSNDMDRPPSYNPIQSQLPVNPQEIVTPTASIPGPYTKQRSLEALAERDGTSPITPSTFTLKDFLQPFPFLSSHTFRGELTDIPLTYQSTHVQTSLGTFSSTNHASSDQAHPTGRVNGETTVSALSGGSGSGIPFHNTFKRPDTLFYQPPKIQTMRSSPKYPSMHISLPNRGKRRLFDSLVAVTA